MRVGMGIEELRALLRDCPQTGYIMFEVETDMDLPALNLTLTDGYECADGMVLVANVSENEELTRNV